MVMKPLIRLTREDVLPNQELLHRGSMLSDDLLANFNLSKGVIHHLEEKMELRKNLSTTDLKERLVAAKKLF